MARIAALLPETADRESLLKTTSAQDVVWAESWRDLYQVVRREPVSAAVADLRAEQRKDGALRVYHFTQRFPNTPILVWGELDGRDMFRLGKAGATEFVLAQEADDPDLVGERVRAAARRGLPRILAARLAGRLPAEAVKVVRHAAEETPRQIQVPALASNFGLSVSTLERRCEQWGAPTPGRLLLWMRVLYGLHWLLEPGRSIESVANQVGYSSGAAFRRALKVTVGGRPTPLRNRRGFGLALEEFLAECPGPADDALTGEP